MNINNELLYMLLNIKPILNALILNNIFKLNG